MKNLLILVLGFSCIVAAVMGQLPQMDWQQAPNNNVLPPNNIGVGIQQQQQPTQPPSFQQGGTITLPVGSVLPQNYGLSAGYNQFGQLQQPILSSAQVNNLIPVSQLQQQLNQRVASFGTIGNQQQYPIINNNLPPQQFGGYQQTPVPFNNIGSIQQQQPLGIANNWQQQQPFPVGMNNNWAQQQQLFPVNNINQQPMLGLGLGQQQQPYFQQQANPIALGQQQQPGQPIMPRF
jgi:hypothetical protein